MTRTINSREPETYKYFNRKTLATGLTALALFAASVGGAEAFDRQVTVTGPYGGGYTKTVDRYCFDGTCYTQSQLVTNYGNEFLRSRSCTLTAPGQYSCQGSLTGPGGGTATRSRTVTVSR